MIKHGSRDEEIRNRKIKKKKKNSQKAKKLDCGIHILTTNFSAGGRTSAIFCNVNNSPVIVLFCCFAHFGFGIGGGCVVGWGWHMS